MLTQVSERSLAAVSIPPERVGAAGVGSASAHDGQLSLNLLKQIYEDDGQEAYDQESLSAVFRELRKFGDLPSVSEVYSVPRVAAQAMTVGVRPGFSIDIGTLKPDGTPWN